MALSRINHILLVDDDEGAIDPLRILFEMEGWQVTSATISARAVKLVQDGLRPDIVLMDYQMPGMTGGEALRHMRHAGMSAPALLVSGINNLQETAAVHGFNACLGKPFSMGAIMNLVHQLCCTNESRESFP